MIEDRLVHQRQADEHGQPVAHDRFHADHGIEAAHQRHPAADRKIAQQQHVAGAVEQRKLPGDAVVPAELHFDGVAHHGHDHGEMTMHRALGPRRRARSVDDHREIAVVELDLRLDLGLALDEIVEILQSRRRDLAGEIDRDHLHAALFQCGAAIGLRVQIVVDQRKTHLGVIEDIVHVGRAEHGVDGNPDQPRAVNAEQRFDELDGVVADRRYLLARLQPALHQIIGEAVGVVLEFGKGHATRAVGERNAIGKPHCGALQEIADRHPPDAAGTGYTAGCCEIGHLSSLAFERDRLPGRSLRGALATKQSRLS